MFPSSLFFAVCWVRGKPASGLHTQDSGPLNPSRRSLSCRPGRRNLPARSAAPRPATQCSLGFCFPGGKRRGKEKEGGTRQPASPFLPRLEEKPRIELLAVARGEKFGSFCSRNSSRLWCGAEAQGASRGPERASINARRMPDQPKSARRSALQLPPLSGACLELERRRRLWQRRALLAGFCNGPRDAETPAARSSRLSHDRG